MKTISIGVIFICFECLGANILGEWDFTDSKFNQRDSTGIVVNGKVDENGVLCVEGTNAPSICIYENDIEGKPLLDREEGAIRIVFQPRWASTGSTSFVGAAIGPGSEATLLELAVKKNEMIMPLWRLEFSPDGRYLMLKSIEGSIWKTNFISQISIQYRTDSEALKRQEPLAPANEIMVVYSKRTSYIVFNGILLQDLQRRSNRADSLILRTSIPGSLVLSIGSKTNGTGSLNGWVKSLATFSGLATPINLLYNWSSYGINAHYEPEIHTVVVNGYYYDGRSRNILRREDTHTNWLEINKAYCGGVYIDRDIKENVRYEYNFGGKRVIVGTKVDPIDSMGKVLVLVDETLQEKLEPELSQFVQDLIGEGWEVKLFKAPRHPEEAWATSPIDLDYISRLRLTKELIRKEADSLRAIVLIGHVVIPFSGAGAEDGHIEHFGAWPADVYFGDLDGIWTDENINTGSRTTHPELRNIPGDAKWDAMTFREISPDGIGMSPQLEVAVGRIDFARMPLLGRNGEVRAIKTYLRKNHLYRHGILQFNSKVLVGTFFGDPWHSEGRVLIANTIALASRMYQDPQIAVEWGNGFNTEGDKNFIFVINGGYGSSTAIHNSKEINQALGLQRISSTDLIKTKGGIKGAFYLLKGSYFGRWNSEDNFLRALLSKEDRALAVMWTRTILWDWSPFAGGRPLGESLKATSYGYASVRESYILGDPTLRAYIVPSVRNVKVSKTDGLIKLEWEPPATHIIGYCVYRSDNGMWGPYRLISPGIINQASYIDKDRTSNQTFYMIRAVGIIQSGSGSFLVLSTGIPIKL